MFKNNLKPNTIIEKILSNRWIKFITTRNMDFLFLFS